MYICMYVYVCMYVCTYVRTYVRVYVCMYVCMYVISFTGHTSIQMLKQLAALCLNCAIWEVNEVC